MNTEKRGWNGPVTGYMGECQGWDGEKNHCRGIKKWGKVKVVAKGEKIQKYFQVMTRSRLRMFQGLAEVEK